MQRIVRGFKKRKNADHFSIDEENGDDPRLTDVIMLDSMGLVSSFSFLIYSSWRDILTREVSDRVWMVFYPVGLSLTLIRLVTQPAPWSQILLSVGITAAVSVALPFLGLWGGADGKAFICLALMNPLTPSLGNLSGVANPFFPLIVFSNAYLASLASLLYPIQKNLRMRRRNVLFEGLEDESRLRKLAAFVTGYQVPIDELESKPHYFLLESVHTQGSIVRRHFELDPRVDLDQSKELTEIKRADDLGLIRGGIWVSPSLPFLVFLTSGLGLSLVFGDILWSFIAVLMRGIV